MAPLFTRIESYEKGGTQRPRHRGPAARHGGAGPEPALRRPVQGRRRRRLQAQPRLQQRGPGRRRQDPGQHQPRPAHERGALLSRAGHAAPQPARRHRGADAPRAAGRQALRRHRLRAGRTRGGGAGGARGHPVRRRGGDAAAAGAVRHRQARNPAKARHRRAARLAGGGRELPRPHQRAHRLAREGPARVLQSQGARARLRRAGPEIHRRRAAASSACRRRRCWPSSRRGPSWRRRTSRCTWCPTPSRTPSSASCRTSRP